MSMPEVGQAQMLSAQFGQLLKAYSPQSVAVVGCAGGNGFDCISPEVTPRVVGVDINPSYLAETRNRYSGRIPGLELVEGDIQRMEDAFPPVDLIYAGLVFEYLALRLAFQSLATMCKPGTILGTVLQLSSSSDSAVSLTPYSSVAGLSRTMRLVPPEVLLCHATVAGFVPLTADEVTLPSGKRFAMQAFRYHR